MSVVFTFPAGKLINDVEEVVLVNNVTKEILLTVPVGKRWMLLAIRAINRDDIARVIGINIWKEAAMTNLMQTIESLSCNQNVGIQYPNYQGGSAKTSQSNMPHLIILEAANTIEIEWAAGGASTGSTDADGLAYSYLEMDV